MRSPPLLLLLIITQCCLLSIAVGDATVERVDHGPRLRFIRDEGGFAPPTSEQLAAFSSVELAAKVQEWEARLKANETEVDRLEREYTAKMGEWSSANRSVIEKTEEWTRASKEYTEKGGPLINLTAQINANGKALYQAQEVLDKAKSLVDIPSDRDDVRVWCTEEMARMAGRIEKLNSTTIPALNANLSRAHQDIKPLQTHLTVANMVLQRKNCSESAEGDDAMCKDKRNNVGIWQGKVDAAEALVRLLEEQLTEARDELQIFTRLEALLAAIDRVAAASAAQDKILSDVAALPGDELSLNQKMSDAGLAKEEAEALVPPIASSARDLEKALAGAKVALEQNRSMHKVFADEAARRAQPPTTAESGTSSDSSFPLAVVVGVVTGILAVVVIVVIVLMRRRKPQPEQAAKGSAEMKSRESGANRKIPTAVDNSVQSPDRSDGTEPKSKD